MPGAPEGGTESACHAMFFERVGTGRVLSATREKFRKLTKFIALGERLLFYTIKLL